MVASLMRRSPHDSITVVGVDGMHWDDREQERLGGYANSVRHVPNLTPTTACQRFAVAAALGSPPIGNNKRRRVLSYYSEPGPSYSLEEIYRNRACQHNNGYQTTLRCLFRMIPSFYYG